MICGEEYNWKQPNRRLVVQTGESVEQAKVFKAHAIPQGVCANLINVLKLLANQQEDGDGLLQNVVTNLGKGSRKGLTDGLRDFIRVDNDRALDVGEVRRGTGTFKVRKPKVPEGGSDVTIRERPDELTQRAEEVETWKTLIDVNHIEPERWCPPLVDADWYAFCQALYKGIEGKDWEEMYDSYKEMSKAVGVKKPHEAQKARALWAMTEGKSFMIRLVKRTFWEELKRGWGCGKSTSKTQLRPWTKPQSAQKISTEAGSRLCGSKAAMACVRVVSDLMLPLWEEVMWPFLGATDSVRLRTASTQWPVPGRYGPHGNLFFFLVENEPMVPKELSRLGPSIRPHDVLFFLIQKRPVTVPNSEAFNSFIGDGFQVPEWKGESEATKDEQADSSSENKRG